MRKLNTADLMKCATILGKVGGNIKLRDGATAPEIGMAFFSSALQYAETDLRALLASVAEMTEEEFDKQPFEYPLQIIEELAEKDEFTNFLERLKVLQKRLSKK